MNALCLSLFGKNIEENLALLRSEEENFDWGLDYIEIRLDFLWDDFCRHREISHALVEEFCEQFRKDLPVLLCPPIMRGKFEKPRKTQLERRFLLLSCRRIVDGGRWQGTEQWRWKLLSAILQKEEVLQHLAFIDLELDFLLLPPSDFQLVLSPALQRGATVLCSLHDISGIWQHLGMAKLRSYVRIIARLTDEIGPFLESVRGAGPSKRGFMVLKLALHCSSSRYLRALLDLFSSVAEFCKARGLGFVGMGMGHCASFTRILGPALEWGSPWAYCAPQGLRGGQQFLLAQRLGQLSMKGLCKLYRYRSIDRETQSFGLLGRDINHSLSPEIHNSYFKKGLQNAVYLLLPCDKPQDILDIADNIQLLGASVTAPHKETVRSFLAAESPELALLGACNTLLRYQGKVADSQQGKSFWYGDNTDLGGFRKSLEDFLAAQLGRRGAVGMKVAVIGAGGAARAVLRALIEMGAELLGLWNRSPEKAEALLRDFGLDLPAYPLDSSSADPLRTASLIIQCSSAGKRGSDLENTDPLAFFRFAGQTKLPAIFELNYSSEGLSPLALRAKRAGCAVEDGLAMLKAQAYLQYRVFSEQLENLSRTC